MIWSSLWLTQPHIFTFYLCSSLLPFLCWFPYWIQDCKTPWSRDVSDFIYSTKPMHTDLVMIFLNDANYFHSQKVNSVNSVNSWSRLSEIVLQFGDYIVPIITTTNNKWTPTCLNTLKFEGHLFFSDSVPELKQTFCRHPESHRVSNCKMASSKLTTLGNPSMLSSDTTFYTVENPEAYSRIWLLTHPKMFPIIPYSCTLWRKSGMEDKLPPRHLVLLLVNSLNTQSIFN